MKNKKSGFFKNLCAVVLGLGVGGINGFFGAGGGMLVVPIFEHFLQVETKRAHATAVLTILPLCVVSAITYIFSGTGINISILPVAVGVVIGGVIGSILLVSLKNKIISFLFNIVMIIAGILMILRG